MCVVGVEGECDDECERQGWRICVYLKRIRAHNFVSLQRATVELSSLSLSPYRHPVFLNKSYSITIVLITVNRF